MSAVVLLICGAFAEPSRQFAVVPYPTKSTTLKPPTGQAPVSVAPLFTSAIFPVVALMFISPTMFAVGSVAPALPPDANAIRKYSPGPIMPPNGCLVAHDVPVAAPYWIVQPALFIGFDVGL